MTNIDKTKPAQPLFMLYVTYPHDEYGWIERSEGPYTEAEGEYRWNMLFDFEGARSVQWVRFSYDLPVHVPSRNSMLPIYLFMVDGSVRIVEFDCNNESAFQALERVYRSDYPNDFDVMNVRFIRFGDKG
jgi:hypothetical protein